MQNTGPAQSQALQVKLVSCLGAAQPGEPGWAACLDECPRPVLQVGFELPGRKMFCRRQLDRFNRPTHVGCADWLALRVFPGATHSVCQPLGESQPVLRRAVIVLARADIAACSIEMNMQ